MAILFFDTETTGLPLIAANDDPRQPHIVQLAAVLTDDSGNAMSSMNVLINLEGFEIGERAKEIHGITEETCLAYGVSEKNALLMFSDMARQSKLMVAHNISFDLAMIRFAMARQKLTVGMPPEGGVFCTMERGRDLCKQQPTEKMLAAGFNGHKNPKLTELYRFLFDEEMSGAHAAMADVQGCMRCYFEMNRRLHP